MRILSALPTMTKTSRMRSSQILVLKALALNITVQGIAKKKKTQHVSGKNAEIARLRVDVDQTTRVPSVLCEMTLPTLWTRYLPVPMRRLVNPRVSPLSAFKTLVLFMAMLLDTQTQQVSPERRPSRRHPGSSTTCISNAVSLYL